MHVVRYKGENLTVAQARFRLDHRAKLNEVVKSVLDTASAPLRGVSIHLPASRSSNDVWLAISANEVDWNCAIGNLVPRPSAHTDLIPIQTLTEFDQWTHLDAVALSPQRSATVYTGFTQWSRDFYGDALQPLFNELNVDLPWSYQVEMLYRSDILEEERWLRKMVLAVKSALLSDEDRRQALQQIDVRVRGRFYGHESFIVPRGRMDDFTKAWRRVDPVTPLVTSDLDLASAGLHPDYFLLASPQVRCAAIYDEAQLTAALRHVVVTSRAPYQVKSATEDWDIFLAHTSEDSQLVHEVYQHLSGSVVGGRRLRVFLDSVSVQPGSLWAQTILGALERSRTIVVFVPSGRQPNAPSPYFEHELQRAIELMRAGAANVIPVIQCGSPRGGVPQPSLPFGLSPLQAIVCTEDRNTQAIALQILESCRV